MSILRLIALSSIIIVTFSFNIPLRTSVLSYHNLINLQLYSSTNPINCESKSDPCKENENCNPILSKNTFLLNIEQSVSLDEISNENIAKIVNLECTDEQCNMLTWKCLGYQYNPATQLFELSDKVFPKWAAKYPSPPDLIGITRNYGDIEVDKPVRDASMNLLRSIPRDFKGGVRNLEPLGLFKGFKLSELTPNKTRRAQVVNWLIFYREKLFGKTLEQLRAEASAAATAAALSTTGSIASNDSENNGNSNELPSEKMYQKTRLDVE